MAINRYYSAVAQDTTITSGISSSSTSVAVGSVTGFPSVPFVVALDYNNPFEELVTVTNISGITLTISRANAGLGSSTVGTPVAHGAGATVRHVITAQDLTEAQAHIAATGAVHGLTGSVAGTTDTQTLTNKTISGASNTVINLSLTTAVTGTLPVANGGTGITSLGTGIATFLGTPTSANLASAVTDEIGSGPLVFANITFNAQTGTTYTLVSTDVSLLVTLNNANPITLTIPPNIFTTGQQINVQQIGAGQVTMAAGSGVTITSAASIPAVPKIFNQYNAATIICTGTNAFTVIGGLL